MKSKQTKFISGLLVFAMVLTLASHFTPHAFAAIKSTVIDSSAQYATVARSTTNEITRTMSINTETIYHVQGRVGDRRSMGGTYTVESARTIVSPMYPSTFEEHSASWELKDRDVISAPSWLYCTISADAVTGTYKIYPVWSGVSLRQEVYTSGTGETTVHQNRYIAYVQCSTSAVVSSYYSL